MIVYLCEDRFDGILCGVYDVYADRTDRSDCRLVCKEEYEPILFEECREVPLITWKAERVAAKIRASMSDYAYRMLYQASLHRSPERAEAIFRFIETGLRFGRRTVNMLQEPSVFHIYQMDRTVGKEAHAQREFLRFEPLANGVYYAKVGPENRIVELIAEHFADRFPDMNWMIHDERHRMAALHTAAGGWIIREKITEEEVEQIRKLRREDVYADRWKIFFHAIAIEERRNERCQRNLLPLRYRKYMTEFTETREQ